MCQVPFLGLERTILNRSAHVRDAYFASTGSDRLADRERIGGHRFLSPIIRHARPCARHPRLYSNSLIKIAPCSILLIYEPRLPNARPTLHVLLALDCERDRCVFFEIDQSLQFIALGKALNRTRTVLVNAANKIVGDADVKRSIQPVGQNVRPRHCYSLQGVDGNRTRACPSSEF
jgi:hypothetical protein